MFTLLHFFFSKTSFWIAYTRSRNKNTTSEKYERLGTKNGGANGHFQRIPISCRYMQSVFGHCWFFMKCEQYLVVPRDVFITRPSTEMLLTAWIALRASSDLEYVTYALAHGPYGDKSITNNVKVQPTRRSIISAYTMHSVENTYLITGIWCALINYDF